MDFNLYKCSSEHNRLNKTITEAKTISGNLKGGCDILNPTITIAYSSDIKGFNYCYIPTFGRYYYINDMKYVNNTIELSMHVDVLMSHKKDILQSKATVTRSNKGNLYLNDDRIKQTAQHTLIHRKIGAGFTGNDCYSLILATYGGN